MRLFPGLNGRAVSARSDSDQATLQGYGAVFHREGEPGTEYWLWDDVVERIMPGTFDRALSEQHDVRSFFNHNPDLILGRTSSGTLDLSVDAFGLRYEVLPPETGAAGHVVASVERGDVTGSSFMFAVTRATWSEEIRDGKQLFIRDIEDVDLAEVGPVVFPAYEGTTAGMRSIGADPALTRYRSWLEGHVTEARDDLQRWRLNMPSARNARSARMTDIIARSKR